MVLILVLIHPPHIMGVSEKELERQAKISYNTGNQVDDHGCVHQVPVKMSQERST